MSDSIPFSDILDELDALTDRWAAMRQRAHDLETNGGDHPPSYYAGMGAALERALDDMNTLLGRIQLSDEVEASDDSSDTYLDVDIEYAKNVLKRAGLSFSKMYNDSEHVFTVIFAHLPPIPVNERIHKLEQAAPNLVILEHGRLDDSRETYIDFAFQPASPGNAPDVRS